MSGLQDPWVAILSRATSAIARLRSDKRAGSPCEATMTAAPRSETAIAEPVPAKTDQRDLNTPEVVRNGISMKRHDSPAANIDRQNNAICCNTLNSPGNTIRVKAMIGQCHMYNE